MDCNKEFLKSGMKRVLMYHKAIHEEGEMKKVCERCEHFCGKQHDYHECTECPSFKMYCELQEYRFAYSFREDMGG